MKIELTTYQVREFIQRELEKVSACHVVTDFASEEEKHKNGERRGVQRALMDLKLLYELYDNYALTNWRPIMQIRYTAYGSMLGFTAGYEAVMRLFGVEPTK